ncbi:hypothetical protein OG2516_18885 [Oceanicola granulosus HTCC2516]|uniref:Uncharacterized protein n=1 Tax=Oceanicola granulosus (strain ATCC BAA-861 / DSM 15982 / KCTC 12143 / HTCC2516) TaxID=314256 RepID=Q2CBU1_OCEGH|nr:hypothetical protein [Oceanicola granulosus]EAR50113.1 hypothetical protein OG2516_18885 [Oceanicola granulosus HTCC2516]
MIETPNAFQTCHPVPQRDNLLRAPVALAAARAPRSGAPRVVTASFSEVRRQCGGQRVEAIVEMMIQVHPMLPLRTERLRVSAPARSSDPASLRQRLIANGLRLSTTMLRSAA